MKTISTYVSPNHSSFFISDPSAFKISASPPNIVHTVVNVLLINFPEVKLQLPATSGNAMRSLLLE